MSIPRRARALAPALALVLLSALPVRAARDTIMEDDAALAERYAPVLYFHEHELFRPQPVEVIVEQARLRQSRRLWFDVNVLVSLELADLAEVDSNAAHFLDIWYGDRGSSAYLNYTVHRAHYEDSVSPQAGGPSAAVYAHVVRDENPAYITIQYWMLYYYNDWFNKHEGDWEMVQVVLAAEGTPLWVVLSQHHGGTRRAWSDTRAEEATHPAVYVALGSHANYFVGDEVYPNGASVGSVSLEIMDRTGSESRLVPELIMIPGLEELRGHEEEWPGASWLAFRGRWGESAGQADFGGPLGPADKGSQWETPVAWGTAQPLDVDAWYEQRLRVEVTGEACMESDVLLRDAHGQELAAAEELGGLAILHTDPPAQTAVVADLRLTPGASCDVLAVWPRPAQGVVTEFSYEGVSIPADGSAALRFSPELAPSLEVQLANGAAALAIEPTGQETRSATWDAADLVWVGGSLAVDEVALGFVVALLGAVLPAVIFVGLLYWADRYEKEPRRLLAAAFLWGAVPAVVTALLVEVFFQLPPQLAGPRALEALRLGIVAPFVQEALKGVAVLVVFWRYRDEFDNVFDGILYGATTGFGFAMTGNLISYLGSFAVWGPAGLTTAAFAEGLLTALNHALYSAVFGAGLGWASLDRSRLRRWAVPALAYVWAVATHALHDLIAERALGLNVITVGVTFAGLGAMAGVAVWSLRRQRRVLAEELAGRVPDDLYREMTTLRERTLAAGKALRAGGLAAWRERRRLRELCAELAFGERRRKRGLPVDPAHMTLLRAEIRELLEKG